MLNKLIDFILELFEIPLGYQDESGFNYGRPEDKK